MTVSLKFLYVTVSIMTPRKMTLSIMTLSIMTLSIKTLSIMTLSTRTFSIMSVSINVLYVTLSINGMQHLRQWQCSAIMLNVVMLSVTVPCPKIYLTKFVRSFVNTSPGSYFKIII